jgi:RNA polymerase sigma-70 factor (ECF subfamily)
LGELFQLHRGRLTQLVNARLEGRLKHRFDASDVIQEAFIRVTEQGTECPAAVAWPSYFWLRRIVLWTLSELQRKHLGAQTRDVRREFIWEHAGPPGVGSLELAEWLLDSMTSPSQAANRSEKIRHVRKALEQLEPIDREVLVLRHVEQLTRADTAALLGISTGAAAKRYFRALARCRQLLVQQGCDNV